jgi:uncharacterized membrane protein YjgN (DUF898 family)
MDETITNNEQESTVLLPEKNELIFKGEGTELLGIMLLNWILTSFTLGLYYPWARVAKLRFLYQNTHLNGTPFVFSGTGKELFKGFIKLFVIIAVLYGGLLAAVFSRNIGALIIVYIIFFIVGVALIPLAIHGALRYRLSRTSWRGIHFGYRGDRGKLIGDFVIGSLLNLFTLGFYQSWFINGLRTYIIGNIRFGSLYMGYDGEGTQVFWINFKGFFLTILTLGLYYFWYYTEYMSYFAKHTYLEQDGQRHYLTPRFSGTDFFGLMIVNLFLTLFTFGFGTPWVITRTVKFFLNNIDIPDGIDLNRIQQTEDDYKDAIGEDVLDYLDLGII